jgi:ERCC4-type nuclease
MLNKSQIKLLSAVFSGKCYTRESLALQLDLSPNTVRNNLTAIGLELRAIDVIREGESFTVPLILALALRFEREGNVNQNTCLECLQMGILEAQRVNPNGLCFAHWLESLGEAN